MNEERLKLIEDRWSLLDRAPSWAIPELIAEVRRLREALEFYADGDYQEGGGIYDTKCHKIDFGQRARDALKGE